MLMAAFLVCGSFCSCYTGGVEEREASMQNITKALWQAMPAAALDNGKSIGTPLNIRDFRLRSYIAQTKVALTSKVSVLGASASRPELVRMTRRCSHEEEGTPIVLRDGAEGHRRSAGAPVCCAPIARESPWPQVEGDCGLSSWGRRRRSTRCCCAEGDVGPQIPSVPLDTFSVKRSQSLMNEIMRLWYGSGCSKLSPY